MCFEKGKDIHQERWGVFNYGGVDANLVGNSAIGNRGSIY